jgi:aryl-alcohol dehydrogenase-like predicted oxidoreductase
MLDSPSIQFQRNAAIHLEAGITLVDTADFHAGGHNGRLIRRPIQDRRRLFPKMS